jgi:DNA-binding NarL/FixJ family response regulator
MIRIILADDHQVVRQGLGALLAAQPDFKVLAETGDGLAALSLAERLQPDVLIVDLRMPGVDGVEVVRLAASRLPRLRTIVLSMYATLPYVAEAFRHGASGYVAKESSAADLVQAVRQVMSGQPYLSPPLTLEALNEYRQQAAEDRPAPLETLTDRERQVLQLLAKGLTSAEIASRLSISRRTAEAHRARVMHKLNVHNPSELVRLALRAGIIPLEE